MPQGGGPSAPSFQGIDTVSGYEGTGLGDGEGKYFPPPDDMVAKSGGRPHPSLPQWAIPAISEDVAREAFVKYASRKCCYSTAPAKELVFQDLQPFNTYRYRLETFTESRSSVWKTTPFKGGVVDSYLQGPAPSPWSMQVDIPEMFKDHNTCVPVPHTSSVKGCSDCVRLGKIACRQCHGSGRRCCSLCQGSGRRFVDDQCTHCHGSGNTHCTHCFGRGTQDCQTCKGAGDLLYYIELQVTWKNNIFEHVVDQRSGFPSDLFKAVSGEKMFVDEQSLVYPVVNFPEPSINHASQNAIVQHQASFTSASRIRRQRQTIELIFLTKVEYAWKGKQYSYFVYGNENKVYAEEYPKKCCCAVM
uniref:Protein SSUH2 homolog n=1 Tax=Sphenodon punctatus TaxID=8508 RepID=A0A8D0GB38_SPHPU